MPKGERSKSSHKSIDKLDKRKGSTTNSVRSSKSPVRRPDPEPSSLLLEQKTEVPGLDFESFEDVSHFLNTFRDGLYEKQRKEGAYCDVILVADLDNVNVPAHRFFMRANSKYFAALIDPKHKSPGVKVDVHIHDMDGPTLTALVRFFYCGKITLTNENIFKILLGAQMFEIPSVVEKCYKFLKMNLSAETCLNIRAFAIKNDLAPLHNYADYFLKKNFSRIVSGKEFLRMDHEEIDGFLTNCKDWSLGVRRELLPTLYKWVEHDHENRASYLFPLMKIFQCDSLFEDFSMLSSTLTSDEELKIKDLDHPKSTDIFVISKNATSDTKTIWEFNILTKQYIKIMDYFSSRNWSCFVYISPKLYEIGGHVESKGEIESCRSLQTTNKKKIKKWDKEPKLTQLRFNFGAIVQNDSIFVFGGEDDDFYLLNSTEMLRVGEERWTQLEPMRYCRSNFALAHFNDEIFVLGGWGGVFEEEDEDEDEENEWMILKSVESYNPALDKWTQWPDMNKERYHFRATVLGNRLYAVGGMNESTVEYFDLQSRKWTFCASLTTQRNDGVVVGAKNRIYAIGGNEGQPTTEIYDPNKNLWFITQDEVGIPKPDFFSYAVKN